MRRRRLRLRRSVLRYGAVCVIRGIAGRYRDRATRRVKGGNGLGHIGDVGSGRGDRRGLCLLVRRDLLGDLLRLLDLGGHVLRLLNLSGDLRLLNLRRGMRSDLLGLLNSRLLGLRLLNSHLLGLRHYVLGLLNGRLLGLLGRYLLDLCYDLRLQILRRHGSGNVLSGNQIVHALRSRNIRRIRRNGLRRRGRKKILLDIRRHGGCQTTGHARSQYRRRGGHRQRILRQR